MTHSVPRFSRICALILSSVVVPLSAQSPAQCDLAGLWVNAQDKTLAIEMTTVNDTWSGSVVRSTEPDMPVGFVMMRDFKFNARDQRYKGRMVRPSGREVSGDLRCEKDGTLRVTGGVAFLRRSIVLRREPADRPPSTSPPSGA